MIGVPFLKHAFPIRHIEAVILNQQDSSCKFGTVKVMINKYDETKAIEILKSTHCE